MAKTNDKIPVLTGLQLISCGTLLAIANFIVMLDITVTNVSVPHIAGGLAASIFEGTYTITSYAVAEAIIVPLTGWLALYFGTLRMFTWGMMLFGIFSAMCALSQSLSFLVFSRIFQGLAGGLLLPLSQILLIRIFPKDKQATAIGIWGTTTLIAPILGPIVGGYICDNWSWPFIFYLNIPIAIICSIIIRKVLASFETPIQKNKIDFVGLVLLVIWVSALQVMLDEGKIYDWFSSAYIVLLLIISVIGFVAFMIWELTEEQPIVNLCVFRHRGYFISVLTISLTSGVFFGTVVLTPLWLQDIMEYTASRSGFVVAMIGVLAVLAAPVAAKFSVKIDPRKLVCFGTLWIGALMLIRSFCTTEMTSTQIAIPILIQGFGMPFFFLPLTTLALSSVHTHEMADATGLLNFVRILSGAIAVSVMTTSWGNQAKIFRAEMVDLITLERIRLPLPILERLVEIQSFTLATNHIFLITAILIFIASSIIWIAPRPKHS